MARFRFDRDRRRYLASHANLRRLLGGYAGCAPQELCFTENEFGKPRLVDAVGGHLHFNLSHSEDVGLLAVTRAGELGADVECVREIEPEVAEAHFSRSEMAELNKLKDSQWLEGFFRCWTRKEAILKAEGCGLNLPLDGFDVSLTPGGVTELLDFRPAAAALSRHWKLAHLEPEPGVVGAVAFGDGVRDMTCLHLLG
jgi:4'-phosphopantetheinyl transferase